MNTNNFPNHATNGGTIYALETRGPNTLKLSLDGIYEMLVKDGYRNKIYKNTLKSKILYKCHNKQGHMID